MENIKNKTPEKHVLQICRLTPLWGMDLFREITHAFKSENTNITTVFLFGKAQPELKNQYQGNIIFLELNRRSIFWRIQVFFKLLKLYSFSYHRFRRIRETLGKQALKYTKENFSLEKYHQNIRKLIIEPSK